VGLRSLLDRPVLYQWVQKLFGAERARRRFLDQYVEPEAGLRVLDLGCGPADLLRHLGDVHYVGVDLSEAYIRQAEADYGSRGEFHCARLGGPEPLPGGPYDRVLAVGLLHHLDDTSADRLLRQAAQVLAPGGALVTLDCCYAPNQSGLSRWMVSRDRGEHVRRAEAYPVLAAPYFEDAYVDVLHNLLRIPYTHAAMVCRKEAV
jgi:SAM-dependent methyltransferase